VFGKYSLSIRCDAASEVADSTGGHLCTGQRGLCTVKVAREDQQNKQHMLEKYCWRVTEILLFWIHKLAYRKW